MPARSSHEALFYEDTGSLVERAAAYLAGGPADGTALVVARAERLPELERALAVHGFELAEARDTERLVTLDAEATLDAILVDGMPDHAAFQARIGALVCRLARRGGLRVYGEMTDLLWTAGRADAVRQLDQLWRELRAACRFDLLLSYREVPAAKPRRAEPPGAADRLASTADDGSRALEARLARVEAERDELVRALGEARADRHAAEETVRARDEIIAVVTHDLRNPLGTIVMGATALLQQGGAPDPGAQRVQSVAERIHRQAERLARQLRDLQDFSDIQRGQLPIARAPHAPSTIIAAVQELAVPLARERGIAFEARAAPALEPLDCDADRVVQALSSLVVNALKVTARGGSIEVGARAAGAPGDHQRVVFFVHHSGPSLDGEEVPAMFAPGWRSKQPGYRGAALGFTIARGVVDAHGGRIWAEDGGGTVLFSLQP